jgi:hypothetical protein
MAKAKVASALPTLAQQAANLTAAPVVQAAQQVAAKVLGSRTVAVAASTYLPNTGNMLCNVASLQRTAKYHENGGRLQVVGLLNLLVENTGKPWQEVAVEIAANYPAGTIMQIGGKVGKSSVADIMRYLQRNKGPVGTTK